jgi:hypothetical protein
MVTLIRSTTTLAAILRSHPPDEKDVFESDFESTDEEGEAGGDEERDSVAERYIQEEERKMKRVCLPKHHLSVDLTMVTIMLRKQRRSLSERRP